LRLVLSWGFGWCRTGVGRWPVRAVVLDNLTEQEVQENIDQLRQGAIVVITAHRLSTVRKADQIAAIDGGEIVEIGSDEEFRSRRGRYFELGAGLDKKLQSVER
jgi:ABC-type transport system involved in cytochrome bd biosynthesis fused ATPase/permease subunit